MFVNDDIVQVLSNGANAHGPTYRNFASSNFGGTKLAALKESSIESNEVWKLLANPVLVLFLTDDKLIDLHIVGV